MAAHSLETLLRLWALNTITTEQAIGQMLQILNEFEPRVKRLEQSIATLQRQLPAAPPPPPTPPPPAARPPKRARRS